jgi:hypothetical protein
MKKTWFQNENGSCFRTIDHIAREHSSLPNTLIPWRLWALDREWRAALRSEGVLYGVPGPRDRIVPALDLRQDEGEL